MNNMELNRKAQSLRRHLGEDLTSPIDVISLMGKIDGLTIVHYPFGENISGMCIKGETFNLIAINSMTTYGRQRYTAAHELFHLYYDDSHKQIVCLSEFNKTGIEKDADLFASYFLMPDQSLYEMMERLPTAKDSLQIEDIIKIEQHFQMSRQAVLWRLVNENFLSAEQAEEFKVNVKSTAARLGYSTALYSRSPEGSQYMTIGNYIKLAEEIKHKELVSIGKYEELLIDAFRDDIVYGIDEGGVGEIFD